MFKFIRNTKYLILILPFVLILLRCGGQSEVVDDSNSSIENLNPSLNEQVGIPNPPPVQKQISAGGNHTCALLSSGSVKCWGDGNIGQLGNGTNTTSHIPVQVSGLTSGVIAISASISHTCALLSSGSVKCWGSNTYGQLGNGTTTGSNVPVQVSGLTSGVSAISSGAYHSCALLSSGSVKCWGDNNTGQLGNGTTTNSNTPVPVSGLTLGVSAISAGYHHTCALVNVTTVSGGITVNNVGAKCWGSNTFGELGNGNNVPSSSPEQVSGLTSGVSGISAGNDYTCALLSSGSMKCWGKNGAGNLGNGTYTSSNIPVQVSGLTSGVIAISAGGQHTCAVVGAGSAKCWGNNEYGNLGNGTTTGSNIPVQVSGLTLNVIEISANSKSGVPDQYTCAQLDSGTAKCWGSNTSGNLGNGTIAASHIPVLVIGIP
jgi:alpha-tubulin suppressor-like RCC1 family protein